MSPRASRIVRLTTTALVLALLVVFAFRVDWAAIWLAVRGASPSLLLAAALVNLLSLVLKGIRWWVFLRPIGVRSMSLAIRATFAGAGLNNVLVANGGEAARVLFVAREGRAPVQRVLATLALERLFELVGYAVLLALAALFLRLPPVLAPVRPYALLVLVVLGALVVYLLRHPGAAEQVSTAHGGWTSRAARWLGRVGATMAELTNGPRVAGALVLSLAVWVLQVATYHLTAMAAHLPIPLVGTVAALLAVNLGFALRATPGSVGVFQVLYAAAATAFGMNRDLAIAAAFLIQSQQMLPVTAIGVLLAPDFLLRRTRPAADESLRSAAD